MSQKTAYICGPLTELPPSQAVCVKRFYEDMADVYCEITGLRAFVPHEHYDPVVNFLYTPDEVDRAERRQVCENTTILIVVAIAPSWGGGIEIEMANRAGIPVIVFCPAEKKISRLLRGNPAVIQVFYFAGEESALAQLRGALEVMRSRDLLVA